MISHDNIYNGRDCFFGWHRCMVANLIMLFLNSDQVSQQLTSFASSRWAEWRGAARGAGEARRRPPPVNIIGARACLRRQAARELPCCPPSPRSHNNVFINEIPHTRAVSASGYNFLHDFRHLRRTEHWRGGSERLSTGVGVSQPREKPPALTLHSKIRSFK